MKFIMKKVFSSLIIIAAVGLSSCKDFLKTEAESAFIPEVIYNSTDFTNYSVSGIYSLLTTDYSYSQRMSLVYANNSDIEWIGADNASYNQNTYRGLSNYLASPSNDALEREWNNLYKIVERSNLVIEGIKASPLMSSGTNTEKTLMNAYLGEALTLRSLAYFDLVRNWGDVPFKNVSTQPDGSNFFLEATDRDVICDSLINDLSQASELVPWIGEGASSTPERISKGFVKGLLAKVALTRGGYSIRNKPGYPTERASNYLDYYKIANKACLDVINSGKHHLNPSFRNIWEKVSSWESDMTYNENLFEVAFGYQRSGEMGYSIGIRFNTNDKYGYGNNANMVQTGAYYYYLFDRSDLRKDATVAYYQYSDASKVQAELFKSNPMDWNFAKWDQRMMPKTFIDNNKNVNGKVGYGINWIMMRYADILLMYAETENEINGAPTDAAKSAFRQVRDRAFSDADKATKVDAYVNSKGSKEDFFNAIVDERAFEFGGEGVRKYDLIRWNLLNVKIQAQRDALKKMLDRQAPYDQLPRAIFYQYKAVGNTDEINKQTINMYDDKGTGDAPAGFTKVAWLNGASDTNKNLWKERVDMFSSGLNTPTPNRHLFPIASTIINESSGKLKNGYGF